MSRSLVIRCRLRAFILERCAHWHIERQRIPAAFIDGIAADLARQVDVRICAELTKPDPTPKPPRPRKIKTCGKRALKTHPSLF